MALGERAELRGKVLEGKYLVGERIGIGGTGVVFAATRLADGAPVVVKTLRPCFVDHPDLGRRLRREAEVARVVPHPGIVRVLDEGFVDDGSPYVVMEYAHGESLSRLLMRRGPLSGEETVAIAVRVCAILHAAHRAGYVHRDVKPEHVLLDRDASGNLVVRLLDFGVCAAPTQPADERQREMGRVFGTPSYVSPEQAAGRIDIDGRADLFSLGVLMWECLTGRLPFRASNVANLLLRIIREDAPPLTLAAPSLAPELCDAVHVALARAPDGRFPSARAMARALLPFLADRVDTERQLAIVARTSSASAARVVEQPTLSAAEDRRPARPRAFAAA
jgi:serine/threonine-protein kinase